MQRVRDGDVARMAVLFERHHRALFGFFARLTSSRDLSEDLVQDVFFRMLKYRHTYQDSSQFTAWMYQIARNVHADSLQKRRLEVVPLDDPDQARPEPAGSGPNAAEQLERRQDVRLLRRALAALPPSQREVLVLSRFQNLKYEQIAEILACETGAVKVRVFRAVRALSRIFHELANERAS